MNKKLNFDELVEKFIEMDKSLGDLLSDISKLNVNDRANALKMMDDLGLTESLNDLGKSLDDLSDKVGKPSSATKWHMNKARNNFKKNE